MTSLTLTVRETLRYRGSIGQWSWMLHRVTGLGVVLFLVLHVIDTSWAAFYPELYVEAIAVYQTPLFTIGEFALVFAVVYHAINGLRIVILDFQPHLWKYQEQAARIVFGITLLILIPVFIGMVGHAIHFYQTEASFTDLKLDLVIAANLPFLAGIVIAAIGAVILSGLFGLISGNNTTNKLAGSQLERFWWSFMRVSGILIVPLVFGHLAMMHVIQGVFDITAAGAPVVGTSGFNESATAVEFVARRWGQLGSPIIIWRIYDVALLALVTIHGFNGLRYVLTDYTSKNPLLQRAAIYLCAIGALVLLLVGAGALVTTIDETAIEMAIEATQHLQAG